MNNRLYRLMACSLCCLLLPATASAMHAQMLPATVHKNDWLPLRQQLNMELQKRLRQQLATCPQWRELINSRKLAIGLVDFRIHLHRVMPRLTAKPNCTRQACRK